MENYDNDAVEREKFKECWNYEAADKVRKEIFYSNIATLVDRMKLNYSADGKFICIYRQDNEEQLCTNILEYSTLSPVRFDETDLEEVDRTPFNFWKDLLRKSELLCDEHCALSREQCSDYHIVRGTDFSAVDVELLIRELRLRLIFDYQFGFITDWKHEWRLLSLMDGIHFKYRNKNNEELDVSKMKAFLTQHNEHSRCVPRTPEFYFTQLLHNNALLCPICTVKPELIYTENDDW